MSEQLWVLVVEPDDQRRARLSSALESAGGTVSSTTDVGDARRRLASDEAPDVALMGDVDPGTLRRVVDAAPTAVRFVCHPSGGGTELASDLLAAGAIDYLHPGTDADELRRRVESASGRTTHGDPETAAILDRMFETSPVGLLVYDADLEVKRLNPRAQELLDADAREFHERMKATERMRDLVDGEGAALERDDLPSAVVVRTGEPVFGRIIGARDEGGETQWMKVNAAPVFRDGELSRVVVAVEDITEQRRRAVDLERQNRRLEGFSDIVSHDLRNPLSVATGYLDLVRNAETEAERAAALDSVEGALDRMEALVNDLRELARSDAAVDDPVPVELSAAAREAWSTVETGDLSLRVEPADAEATILADSGRLRQLFENLFRNVREHAASATTVTVRSTADGFEMVDDGPGLGDVDEPFEPGVSGDGGTGLGLAIVADVAEAHGWEVTVDDAPDGGARFRFTGVDRAA